ncbi:alpha/beta fold hydrolase [Chelativorans sp. YIM 93263]|uniref:alpha/beta fold hydrolase n=1 Tax=Chelativorans sp. YIM 93263 TaxID=2906648 RepID=UPI00237828A9|nr:alpha/beta hydrolase [Chelativorans sp. YIM 93263]
MFVHGIGASHGAWDGVVEILKSDFRCITYDLRGHGEATVPEHEFGLDELVDDLERLRARLGLDRMHVAGHSLGGMIGPAYARKYPNRVTTLALLSTAAGRTESDSEKVQGVVARMEKEGIGNVLETLVDRWYTDEFARANPGVVEARLKQVMGTDPKVFLNVFHIYAETEMAPWLHEIATPSLVLTGEFDGGCNPRLNEFIHSQLQNSELVILKNLKHSILAEAPSKVASEINNFIAGQKPQAEGTQK